MKRFLAIYIGTEDALARAGWNGMDEAARKAREAEGMRAWMDWGTEHAVMIVDQGSPLGKTKRASREGISDTRNSMTGYVIVEAESHEAAARLFENHPHFTIFPGDSVEIMECLPLPER
jgi:transcription antitermination factor NusG